MVTSDWPSEETERTSSTWLMVLTASSTFLEISVSISSGRAGVGDDHHDGGDIDLGKQVDAEREVGKDADYDQRQNQHGREDRAADAKLGECMHGVTVPEPERPRKSSLCPLAATVSLPFSPLTMRIWSPSTSPVTTTWRWAILFSMVKTW